MMNGSHGFASRGLLEGVRTVTLFARRFCVVAALTLAAGTVRAEDAPASVPALEKQMRKEGAEALAEAARVEGDAARGALLFYQPYLACTQCHLGDDRTPPLGPDLATLGKDASGPALVEAILDPSKTVRKGFETVVVVTADGKTVTGRLVENRPDAIVLRGPALDPAIVTVKKADIEEQNDRGPSLMPAGLVNQLPGGRRDFLDLVRYLMEITEKGPARAVELRPDPALLSPPLPAYEKKIDHAGMIAGLNDKSYARGEEIYGRVCANCHGTRESPGSLPTSLRFATGAFKNGSDPYSMYQTLTRGFAQMAPQAWMVPIQKYDVIHYIREAYLKEHNPAQYVRVDGAYLGKLPKGSTHGPKPQDIRPWINMDYGPSLMATIEIGADAANFAYKGIAIRLDAGQGGVSRGRAWTLYDHDTLRLAASWTGDGFIDWQGINFNGKHEVHPRALGLVHVANPVGPGWANPEDGRFDDPRLRGRDGRPYGPLPRAWAHYQGLYHHGTRAIVSYTVGATTVLEMPGLEIAGSNQALTFTRAFRLGPRARDMTLQVARLSEANPPLRKLAIPGSAGELIVFGTPSGNEHQAESATPPGPRCPAVAVRVAPPHAGFAWRTTADGHLRLRIPAGSAPLRFEVRLASVASESEIEACVQAETTRIAETPPDLELLTRGGPPRWPDVLATQARTGADDEPFAVDVLTHPQNNPWLCQMRFTGFDFLRGGDALAVCTWDGDVWRVTGIDNPAKGLAWRRIASGLFQPLGLKVVGETVFVGCRDQICILRDRNGDGETDFYENFNSDHQVTEHFHEFAMDLETDAAGNFYYAKAARHGKTALVPQHGTLLRVSDDGSRTDILATGFRAPNGVCLNPDGTFFMTDQEGFWHPKNRINWVKPGGFYGNMWGYHGVTDTSDSAMEQPVCWITNAFDRSPAQIIRVVSEAWGPLRGALLNLSYGYGKIFVVAHETVDGQMQGGMAALPIPQFPTGLVRGRFHPTSGQLYTCGMYAWAGTQTQPGGLFRVRYTGKPLGVPLALAARRDGMAITFSAPLERAAATDPRSYQAKTWSLKRSEKYGSDHIDERPAPIESAALLADGRTVLLSMPTIAPTWCMEINYAIKGVDGSPVHGTIDNTIHRLRDVAPAADASLGSGRGE
jgi:putative heme-binding domain-containing protein